MPLKDEITVFLTEMAASGAKPIEQSTPAEVRALTAELKELYGMGPEMARVEEHTISGADGGSFPVRVFVPEGTPRGVLIFYHGGGWVIGAIDEFDTLARKLARGPAVRWCRRITGSLPNTATRRRLTTPTPRWSGWPSTVGDIAGCGRADHRRR